MATAKTFYGTTKGAPVLNLRWRCKRCGADHSTKVRAAGATILMACKCGESFHLRVDPAKNEVILN